MDGHAMPVDEDSLRCLKRLGIVEDMTDVEAAQGTLENLVPKTKGIAVAEALTTISQDYCFEAMPKCPPCPMNDVCPSAVLKKAATSKLATAKAKK
jgi:endonuclease III